MEIAFDPAKDEVNRDKHGVSLAFGAALFDDPDHIVLPSIRPVDGKIDTRLSVWRMTILGPRFTSSGAALRGSFL